MSSAEDKRQDKRQDNRQDERQDERQGVRFVEMEAAMLAGQNERLDALNESIIKLTKAVDQRPTKFDLERARKRGRNQLIGAALIFSLVIGGLFIHQQNIKDGCEDRNANAAAFRVLLTYIVERTRDPGFTAELKKYTETLRPIEC